MSSTRYVELLRRLDAARRAGVTLGLDRVRAALQRVGDPQTRFRAVHIAGTNGKGSTAAMTESILRAAGFRTGLFTSPHLCRFTERIRIEGDEVDGDWLAAVDDRIEAALAGTEIALSYFERATVLAFVAFAEAGVELAVIETGLGGRLDATSTCAPVATAITNVGMDHTDVLGSTLPEIAREKAGIAKRGVPLLLGTMPVEAETAVRDVAAAIGAPVRRFGQDFGPAPALPALGGGHQESNAALANALAQLAAHAAGRSLPASAVAAGLASVSWPGRLERLGNVLLDCAHNGDGAMALAAALIKVPERPRVLVLSVVRDKDAGAIARILVPTVDAVVLTQSRSDRALTTHELAAALPATASDVTVSLVPSSKDALDAARQFAGAAGLVVVTGSIFLVGEVRACLLGETCDPIPTSDPPALPRARSQ